MPRKNKKISLWGVGIEAEFALFHDPRVSLDSDKPVYLFFDPQKSFEKPMRRFYYYFYTRPPSKSKNLMFFPPKVQKALSRSENIDVEHAGKICKGKVVVGNNYDYIYYLLEARTEDPFSGKTYGTKHIESYVDQIQKNIKQFLTAYKKYRPEYQKKENKVYGPPVIYPYGMSSRINLRNLNTNMFKNGPIIDNYTGSYHFTFTLPHESPASCKILSENHRYFANLIQWVEPLIASAYHSSDDRSVGRSDKYTKGSFRVVMTAWGDFGGSDIRKIRCVKGRKRKGPVPEIEKEMLTLSRYATRRTEWRDNLPFKDVDLLEPCQGTKGVKTSQNSLGSDFRTPYLRFASKRRSHYLQGLEIRIFDWFHPKHLPGLSRILVYIAERSRTCKKKKYVYKNKYWRDSVRSVMIHGWNAKISRKYVDELQKVFDFKIKPRNLTAHSVLKAFVKSLFNATSSGVWTKLLTRKKYRSPPSIPKINRRSWEISYVIHLMENRSDLTRLKKLAKDITKKNRYITDIRKIYKKNIGGSRWSENFEDILGFLQTQGIISWKFNYEGDIESITPSRSSNIKKLDNLRKIWSGYMNG